MIMLKKIISGIPVLGRFFKGRPLGVPETPVDPDPTHAHFHGVDVNGPDDQPIRCITIDSTEPFGVVIAIPKGSVLGDEMMRVINLNQHNFNENTIILDLRHGVKFSKEN